MAKVVNQNGLHEIHEFLRTKHVRGDTGFTQPMLDMIKDCVIVINERLESGYEAKITLPPVFSVSGKYEEYTITDNGLSEVV